MRTVTFYSYKGGTGRTLLVANTALFLASAGRRVAVLDLDLEAPGLPYKFGLKTSENVWDPGPGFVGYLAACRIRGTSAINISELTRRVPLPDGTKGSVVLIPAGAAPSSEYARALSQTDWYSFYWGGDRGPENTEELGSGKWIEAFETLKSQIEGLGADYLLIDSRTGLADISGVSLNLLPNVIVCLMLLNDENREGARQGLRGASSAAKSERRPLRILPVVARIPRSFSTDQSIAENVAEYLTQTDGETGFSLSRSDLEKALCLHSEPGLQVVERLLSQSKDVTLRESALLKDYLDFFQQLDPGEFRKSPLFASFRLLSESEVEQWLVKGSRPLDNTDESSVYTATTSPIENRVTNRDQMRVVAAHYLPGAACYTKFWKGIIDSLNSTLRISKPREDVPEKNIVYDLLGFQMKDGRFDFCAEAYFLTKFRRELADLLQFGELRTFVMVYAATRAPLGNTDGASLAKVLEELQGRERGKLSVGMLGDTAATSASSPTVADQLSARQIRSFLFPKELAKFLLYPSKEFRIGLMDHGVFARIKGKNPDGAFFSCVLPLPEALSVGFLLPRGDSLWRRRVAIAVAESLRILGLEEWEIVRRELHEEAKVEVFEFNEFCKYLSLDMTLKEAGPWLSETIKAGAVPSGEGTK